MLGIGESKFVQRTMWTTAYTKCKICAHSNLDQFNLIETSSTVGRNIDRQFASVTPLFLLCQPRFWSHRVHHRWIRLHLRHVFLPFHHKSDNLCLFPNSSRLRAVRTAITRSPSTYDNGIASLSGARIDLAAFRDSKMRLCRIAPASSNNTHSYAQG